MKTFNANNMQLQRDLEALLIEIVQNQFTAGHFDVAEAILKFQNSLPNFVMPNLANLCGAVSATAAAMTQEQKDALLAKNLPIAMPGHYGRFEELVQRPLVGSITQEIFVNERSVYTAEQYVNLCDIVRDLERALHVPEAMLNALEDAREKAVEWQNFVIRTYDKQLQEEAEKKQRELEIAAAKK